MSTDAKIQSETEAKSSAETNETREASCEHELNLTIQEAPGTNLKPEPQPEPGRIPDAQIAKEFRMLRDSIRIWVFIVLTDRLAQDGDTFIRRFSGDRHTYLCSVVWCMLESLIFADPYPLGFTASQKVEIANIDNESKLSEEDKEKKKAKKLIECMHSSFSDETSNSILKIYKDICEQILVHLLGQETFAKWEQCFKTCIFGPAITTHALMRCSRSQYRVGPPQALLKFTDASPSEIGASSMKAQHNGITEVSRWAINNTRVSSHWLHLELNDLGILFQRCESEYVEVPELSDDSESSYSEEGSSQCLEEDDSGSCYDGVTEPEDDGPCACKPCGAGLVKPGNNSDGEYSNEQACNPKYHQVCETLDDIHTVSLTSEGRPGRKKDKKWVLIKTGDGVRCELRDTMRAGRNRLLKVPGLRLPDDDSVGNGIQDLQSRGGKNRYHPNVGKKSVISMELGKFHDVAC